LSVQQKLIHFRCL